MADPIILKATLDAQGIKTGAAEATTALKKVGDEASKTAKAIDSIETEASQAAKAVDSIPKTPGGVDLSNSGTGGGFSKSAATGAASAAAKSEAAAAKEIGEKAEGLKKAFQAASTGSSDAVVGLARIGPAGIVVGAGFAAIAAGLALGKRDLDAFNAGTTDSLSSIGAYASAIDTAKDAALDMASAVASSVVEIVDFSGNIAATKSANEEGRRLDKALQESHRITAAKRQEAEKKAIEAMQAEVASRQEEIDQIQAVSDAVSGMKSHIGEMKTSIAEFNAGLATNRAITASEREEQAFRGKTALSNADSVVDRAKAGGNPQAIAAAEEARRKLINEQARQAVDQQNRDRIDAVNQQIKNQKDEQARLKSEAQSLSGTGATKQEEQVRAVKRQVIQFELQASQEEQARLEALKIQQQKTGAAALAAAKAAEIQKAAEQKAPQLAVTRGTASGFERGSIEALRAENGKKDPQVALLERIAKAVETTTKKQEIQTITF